MYFSGSMQSYLLVAISIERYFKRKLLNKIFQSKTFLTQFCDENFSKNRVNTTSLIKCSKS